MDAMLELFAISDDGEGADVAVGAKRETCMVDAELPEPKRPKIAVVSVLWAKMLKTAFEQAGCSKVSRPVILHSLCSGMGTDSFATKDSPHHDTIHEAI